MSRTLSIATALLMLSAPALLCAQDEGVALGDVARAARLARVSKDQNVIDNDNLGVVMEKAESERLNGKPVFSIDPSGNSFRMTSPDGTCSLSFDARATALISTPYIASPLPQDELLKLEGPAVVHDGILEVSLHNGTAWELKEIVVGITVLQGQSGVELKSAQLLPGPADEAAQRYPDLTMLYHLKAAAPPDSVTVFRGDLGGDLDAVKDWHWALISARGIPPAAPGSIAMPAAAGNADVQPGPANTAPLVPGTNQTPVASPLPPVAPLVQNPPQSR